MKEKSQKRAFPQKLTEWKEHLLLGREGEKKG